MAAPRHVHEIYIRATPEEVWQALVDPSFTKLYFFEAALETSLEPGSSFRYVGADGSTMSNGVIEEIDPPRRLVLSWRVLWDTAAADEPPGRLEWQLTPTDDGSATRVRVIHRDLVLSPRTSDLLHGHWPWIACSLKTLLETRAPLLGAPVTNEASTDTDSEWHRAQAVEINNATFDLLGRTTLTSEEGEELVRRAYAAAYHWSQAVRRGPENAARAEYLIAKAHVRVGHAAEALRHANRCWELTTAAALNDFDLAYAHEVRARALALCGDADASAAEWRSALAVRIADKDDREIVDADFADAPR
jgi:uncharacterized protein YndB with AHSA1/START domain